MNYRLLTPPAIEPVSLADAKLHLRVDDGTTDDTLIVMLLAAAREWAEEYCRRAFITQTWRATLNAFPSRSRTTPNAQIRLARAPLVGVTSINYVDAAGATVLLAATEYVLDMEALPPAITPAYGTSWPAARDQTNAVTVEFVAGYGASASSVPAAVRAAMLLAIGDLYANRERQIIGAIVVENPTAAALLAPYRVLEAV